MHISVSLAHWQCLLLLLLQLLLHLLLLLLLLLLLYTRQPRQNPLTAGH